MIIEIEFLEQILDGRWSLAKSVEFIAPHKNPWPVLRGLWQTGEIVFLRADDTALQDWEVQELLRTEDIKRDLMVRITGQGAKRAVG